MERNKDELGVITKAKELCAYIFAVTQKSPKQYRFTFTSKLQNLALSVIENLYRANDTPLAKGDMLHTERRIDYQFHALTDAKLLAYFSMLAMENGCILTKQYENIAKLSADCQYLTGGWINSDKKRI